MTVPLSFALPSPLEYFSNLVAEDQGFALLEAAISIGQDQDPLLDPQGELARLDELGERLRQRLPADATPIHKLRILNRFFFRELGFAANVNHFHDPENSYLHKVLTSRRGIPVTLALLFTELAGQIGLAAQGVSFPGHFLVKLRLPAGEVIIDPVSGHSLSRDELELRLEPYRQQRGLVGEFEVPLGLFLQAASPREVIARMLGNLKLIFGQAEDWPRLLQVQQRLVRLLPEAWDERRDRGLVLAELGRLDAASEDLLEYLSRQPDAEDAAALKLRLAEWRDSPRPLLR
jgi:regulator of sirC expression with transglutaminase-like and TPR domain